MFFNHSKLSFLHGQLCVLPDVRSSMPYRIAGGWGKFAAHSRPQVFRIEWISESAMDMSRGVTSEAAPSQWGNCAIVATGVPDLWDAGEDFEICQTGLFGGNGSTIIAAAYCS
jgi:hypothetical protein